MGARLTPTMREHELAYGRKGCETEAELLARFREELLKPFEELMLDLEALGDTKIARALCELLTTARGQP